MTIQPFDIAIDVGDAQPNIDWPAVFASGIRIAMVKATEGLSFLNPLLDEQYWGASNAGIKPVPYHFMRPVNAQAQAQHFINTIQPAKGDAIAIDWEGRSSQTSSPAVCEAVGLYLGTITGRKPLGYWGIYGSTPGVPTAAMLTWDRWVPRYPHSGTRSWAEVPLSIQRMSDSEWPNALFAQYTMWGQVPGIQGMVDRSVIFANSIDEALAWYATGARPA